MEFITSNKWEHPPYRFLIQALVQAGNPHISNPGQPLAVEFKVNGVSLPFEGVVLNFWERMEASIEEQAEALLVQRLRGSRLESLQSLMEQFEWQVTQEINKLFPPKT